MKERANQKALSVHGSAHTVLEATDGLVRSESIDTFMHSFVVGTKSLVMCDNASFSVPEPSGDLVMSVSTDGPRAEALRYHQGGLGSLVINTHRPFVTANYAVDDRFEHTKETDRIMARHRTRSCAAFPFFAGNAVVGVLSVGKQDQSGFCSDELETMMRYTEIAERIYTGMERMQRMRLAAEEARRSFSLLRLHETIARSSRETLGPGELVQLLADNLNATVFLRGSGQRIMRGPTDLSLVSPPPLQEFASYISSLTDDVPIELGHLLPGLWGLNLRVGSQRWTLAISSGSHRIEREVLTSVVDALAVFMAMQIDGDELSAEGTELLLDLIESTPQSETEVRRRIRRLGIDPTQPSTVLVASGLNRQQSDDVALALSPCLSAEWDGSSVFVLPRAADHSELLEYGRRVHRLTGSNVRVCAAASDSMLRVEGAIREALSFRQLRFEPDGEPVRTATSLGLIGILTRGIESPTLQNAVERLIGPLLRYDDIRGTDLAFSLKTYLTLQNNHAQTAKKLHVHPNTLYRRLQRIDELIGDTWRKEGQAADMLLAFRLAGITRRHDVQSDLRVEYGS